MDDSLGDGQAREHTIVDGWLAPLGDPPCGEDLEYDNAFAVDLALAVSGRPGSQFDDAAVPPDWRSARNITESLFDRTRDLRVAIAWARAMVNLEGAVTLADSLRLIHGLLDGFWDELHPKPDDGDAYARINALNEMCSQAGLLGDLRNATIIQDRAIGELRGREVEIALGLLEARADESPPSRGAIQEMLADAVSNLPTLRTFPTQCVERLNAISGLMQERVGYGSAPDLQPFIGFMEGLAGLMPAEPSADGESSSDAPADDTSFAADDEPRPRRRGGGGGSLGSSIDSREDALRAIDMVCDFLERTEPTNPAPLFLRRARKLVNKNFIELVRELAPESLEQVARLVGLSPEEISPSDGNE